MSVKQAANVVELLEFFAELRRPAKLAEIADGLGWPRSSTFNLVGTLVERGYLYEPRQRGGYYPSPRWQSVIEAVGQGDPLPESLPALARAVMQVTGETTAIGSASGAAVTFLEVAESDQPIRYFAKVGDTVPIHASSVGRAILAQFSAEERQALYRKLAFERYSPTTPADAASIEAELTASAARGYHQSDSEYVADLAGVSLPLTLPLQAARGRRLAIVVAGPASRCLERRAETAGILHEVMARFGFAR